MKRILTYICLFISSLTWAQDGVVNKNPLGLDEMEAGGEPEYTSIAKFNGDSTNVEFVKYIQKEIVYPKQCRKNKEEGKVYVSFVVTYQGKVEDVKIHRSSGNTMLDEEALRVVKSSPDWTPANKNGKNVGMAYKVPILFKLN
jgi:TonB family protein